MIMIMILMIMMMIQVENLTPMHRYRFRAVAVNKIGASDPCEMSGDDILAKDPWDEPDPCGKPDIVDWSPNHADLVWDLTNDNDDDSSDSSDICGSSGSSDSPTI